MDGNGRWAKQQGKLRIFGHQNGVRAVRNAVSFAAKHQIKVLTLYAFSSENWSRPESEVSALMALFIKALDSEVKKLHKNNIRLKIIGNIHALNDNLQQRIIEAEKLTAQNSGLILNIAVNYGGDWDIVQAVQRLAQGVKAGQIEPEQITKHLFQQTLSTEEQPQVDLLIRTSGEQRISNFLLWQIAYAELFFTPILWPEFNDDVFMEAIIAYQQRDRRFGGS
ncbi:di-trans,poly-cis-decaprenylcistransferase [Pasteurellaceae bacterium Macca]|nr:di-trans,poly-cis-decaprenylcistransferase [Pasteurellaceae bacterium Macca]